ncbi:hypothetical protein BDV28DRAFT_142066 [Aspergillus coremiiformis]|uniref:Extracellular serine-rich protein n=1 Tax=Aspergillus coremiiformis TaxID=138285 RepID=A0A5N6YU61_9EURO|nr:hypothetical protein BDV28DRAFT_142066 [Aspergillus coremiiformis]
MVLPWLVRAGCYFGLITCDTPPGVWPEGIPSVIAPVPPSRTSGVTSTSTPGTTSSALSFPSSPIVTGSSSFISTFPSSSFIPTVPSSSFTAIPTSRPSFSSTPVVSASHEMSLPSSVAIASSSSIPSPSASVAAITAGNVAGNILVIAKDTYAANVASSGLNGYGIPFTTLLVPQAGVSLPALNGTSGGNFGGIVVASDVSYDYGGTKGFQSALTTDQWNQLYAYQLAYSVRMVLYDVYPGPNYGSSAVGGGCCASGVDQLVSFSDVSDFPAAGLKTGAGVATTGLWHYPATISNTTSTKEIARFSANANFGNETTAAVINNFDGRQQMAFFLSFDTTWSATSNYLQHAWINWVTRGLYAGHRRVNLNTQIDDMFLETDLYKPKGKTFRITPADMDGISAWLPSISAKMNPGSSYYVEVGHNGNGNIEASASVNSNACNGGGIEYNSPPDTPLEFKKPLGTGTDLWPKSAKGYNWSTACTKLDKLFAWFTNPVNRDKYGHISHTFTHEEQNNATFSDVNHEISYNQAWLRQSGFYEAKYFTSNGIIPPAITGLHNGDALRAWYQNGITNCVGDNTRQPLLNQQNAMWPYFTTVDANGFDGMQVNPRWATRIYYNCDTPDCTLQEWIDTSAGSGDFQNLLQTEKADTMRHLFGLHRDPYMFHQANLRNVDLPPININGQSGKFSIFQAWVEVQVQEFVRLVNWPLITITHQEMSAVFLDRFNRDKCNYSMQYAINNKQITGLTLSANGNTCSVPIPVSFPVPPTDTKGFTTEQHGSDPLTVWVKLSGTPVTFSLSTPIPL